MQMLHTGIILIIRSTILKIKDNNKKNKCTQKTKGTVIEYPILAIKNFDPSRVYCPIVQYSVNNNTYEQQLKYRSVTTYSTMFNKNTKAIDNFNPYSKDLIIRVIGIKQINPLKKIFPIGSEIDVYYNPNNPKESYVLRYVENIYSLILLTIGITLIILFIIFSLKLNL